MLELSIGIICSIMDGMLIWLLLMWVLMFEGVAFFRRFVVICVVVGVCVWKFLNIVMFWVLRTIFCIFLSEVFWFVVGILLFSFCVFRVVMMLSVMLLFVDMMLLILLSVLVRICFISC